MDHETIVSSDAPKPIGPFSPAVVLANLVFLSGQGPVDPISGRVVEGNILIQTQQALTNLEALLIEAGSSRSQALKVQVYLADINDFEAMNEAYEAFFDDCPFPARTTIEAGKLPGGIAIEIDMIAYRKMT